MASPDFILKAFNKVTEESCKIGCAWINEKGYISIQLNLCTVLTKDKNISYILFPAKKESEL